jgi:hypothetical protein
LFSEVSYLFTIRPEDLGAVNVTIPISRDG